MPTAKAAPKPKSAAKTKSSAKPRPRSKGATKSKAAAHRVRAARSKPAAVDVEAQIRVLKRLYPGARCSLDYANPFQLLVATILSAQCTDERVNRVTPDLFRRYPTPAAFAEEESGEIEEAIRSTGFFRNKARAIQEASRDLVERHSGSVPARLEDLVVLRGVGRKTANVVLGNAFDIASGVVVDTHVSRLAQRLGLTREKDPVKIERDLMEKVPKRDWVLLSHLLIFHGRAVCQARTPRCGECALAEICPKIGVLAPRRPAR